MIEASKDILYARRRIEEIGNVEIIDDLKWDDQSESWYIKIRIYDIETNNANVPENTLWYVTFKNDYPKGEIKVFPSVDGGITYTFNHQNNNGIVSDNKLWRKGNLCLSDTYDGLLRVESEPSNYQDKLFWNVTRAVEWVKAAATNRLICENDFYEKPDFNTRLSTIVVYNEDIVSMLEWEENDACYGYVDLLKVNNNQYFAESFVSNSGSMCKGTKWGSYLNEYKNTKIKAAWILLKKEPVINGWQAPNTYAELSLAMNKQGINIIEILKSLMKSFRDGKRHAVMVGFPIPEKIGGSPDRIHWETFMLPVLSHGDKTAKGFRNNEAGWQMRDFQQIILGNKELDWLVCENWNSNEILNRGRFSNVVSRKRILLIGAGTLGSCVGEQLVRGGAYKLTIMDSDIYMIGNTARHILDIASVRKFKAEELAKHYNSVNPNATVNWLNEDLTEKNVDIIDGFDIIIDCTASNDVIKILEYYKPRKEKIYISVSFGYKAELLFLSYSKGRGFDLESYVAEFGDYLRESQVEYMKNDLLWEGVGCWHPVFPAMAYDVQLVASFAMDVINRLLEQDNKENRYCIYKKQYDQDGVIRGFARI